MHAYFYIIICLFTDRYLRADPVVNSNESIKKCKKSADRTYNKEKRDRSPTQYSGRLHVNVLLGFYYGKRCLPILGISALACIVMLHFLCICIIYIATFTPYILITIRNVHPMTTYFSLIDMYFKGNCSPSQHVILSEIKIAIL